MLAVDIRCDPVFVAGVERAEEIGRIGVSERGEYRIDVVLSVDLLNPRETTEVLEVVFLGAPGGDGYPGGGYRVVIR